MQGEEGEKNGKKLKPCVWYTSFVTYCYDMKT